MFRTVNTVLICTLENGLAVRNVSSILKSKLLFIEELSSILLTLELTSVPLKTALLLY